MSKDFLPSAYCNAWRQQHSLSAATWHGDCWQCPHQAECVYAHPGPEWVRVDDVIRPDGTRPHVELNDDELQAARALLADIEEPAQE